MTDREGGADRKAGPTLDARDPDDRQSIRVGFVLQVRPDRMAEYRAHHEAVWPEMLVALSRHGWRNYSLFLRRDGSLFGYVEVDGTFEEALAGMAGEPVNDRWQSLMAPFFDSGRAAADTMMEQLDEVFHLD